MKRFENIINTAIKESMSDIYITGEHPVVTRKFGDIQSISRFTEMDPSGNR